LVINASINTRDIIPRVLPESFEQIRNRMSKILVVDDETVMRETIARFLRKAGYVVETAKDGSQCLEMYRAAPADLVLMDLFMPNKEGLETITELRREFPSAAVIAMSGHELVGSMLRAATVLGAIKTIEKPFTPEALLALVAQELRAASQTPGQAAA
jgi:CheY-like chemotaxis protein